MADILIIDDDQMLCDILCLHLAHMGHDVAYAMTMRDGFKKLSSGRTDIVFLDVRLPDGNGLDMLPNIRKAPSLPEVIIFTAKGSPDGAETAIKNGAWDYIEKPLLIKELKLPLIRALQYRTEKLKNKPRGVLKRCGIVGSSMKIEMCLDLLSEAAGSEENVLITGETGTGKEIFASAIHQNSKRSTHNFIVLDCAAVPGSLVESQLFGHEKGAFTGADKRRNGLIKQSDGGTLFLDEVGELPLPVQKSFLRVLQEHSFRPLGGGTEIYSNFRVLAATHRNLDQMVAKGKFREDLLFRLKSLVIHLPPLRKRPEDIMEIAMSHLNGLSKRYGTQTKGISPDFLEAIYRYPWPGNVRELKNAIERALVTSRDEPTLFPRHFPTNIRIWLAKSSVLGNKIAITPQENKVQEVKPLPTLKSYREKAVMDIEREYLEKLMSLGGNDIKEACHISGLSQSRLYFLLKKYDLRHC
jgi:two-component system, NtrC family, response regulator